MHTYTSNAGILSSVHKMLLTFNEKRFAKRLIKRLLKSYSAVNVENLGLSGITLYREVLLHSQQVDPTHVDQILRQAERSVDNWTAPGRDGLGFREVVHFFVLEQYRDTGRQGSVVSFGGIVNSLIPAHL